MNQGLRRIRVFLSSTFQDLQPERDYLVKHTFPAIKKIAEQRYVDFSVVDLRWGITEEQARQGKVIEICLNEIDNTRPFFIGLVGSRYGWCPELKDIAPNKRLLNLYPWVRECIDRHLSVTEIEMRYGVLMNDEEIHSHFYFKSDVTQSNEEEELQIRLNALHDAIKKKANEGKCGLNKYTTPRQLGRRVYKALLAWLDELYPESTSSIIERLVERQNYLVKQHQITYVDTFGISEVEEVVTARRSNKWCIVLKNDERGVGKSALISNWWKDDKHVIRTLLNAEDNTAATALAHFREELKNRHLEAKDVIWIIDGLDELQPYEDRMLQWLSCEELRDTRLLLTTYSDLMEMRVKLFAKSVRRPITIHELIFCNIYTKIRAVTRVYLNKQFVKHLSPNQLRIIARHYDFSNTFILKIFLHELLVYGEYGTQLTKFMKCYLNTKYNEDGFFGVVLERIRNDFGKETVNTYFGMLSLTKYGIREQDMQNVLGMKNIDWSAFSESVKMLTVRRGDLLYAYPHSKLDYELTLMKLDHADDVKKWHQILLRIYKKMYRKKIHDSAADTYDLELLQTEIATHYIGLGQPHKMFSNLETSTLKAIMRHDETIAFAYEEYLKTIRTKNNTIRTRESVLNHIHLSSSDERVYNIEKRVNQAIRHLRGESYDESVKDAIAAIYIQKSYCLHRHHKDKRAYEFYKKAIQIDSVLAQRCYVLRTLLYIRNNNYYEVMAMLTNLHTRAIEGSLTTRRAIFTQLFPLVHLASCAWSEMPIGSFNSILESIKSAVSPHYEMDSDKLYTTRRQTADILATEGYPIAAAKMYLEAADLASNENEREVNLQLAHKWRQRR